MKCDDRAVLRFSEEEIKELYEIVNSGSLEKALKVLADIDKRIEKFIEPH